MDENLSFKYLTNTNLRMHQTLGGNKSISLNKL